MHASGILGYARPLHPTKNDILENMKVNIHAQIYEKADLYAYKSLKN